MKIRYKKLNENAVCPTYGSAYAAGADLYALTEGEDITIATLSGNTRQSNGTSYSAARVTAEAAKLLQKNPDLTATQLREKLLGSAQSLPDGRKYIP